MKIIWLGHASFRIEIEDQVLLIDPWLTGNPMLDAAHHDAATIGATHILITHAHADHMSDTPRLARNLDIPVVGQYDLMGYLERTHGISTIGYNKGGTVHLGAVSVTMVNAVHSSTMSPDGDLLPAGTECGYMISGDGHTIYLSGDTDVMADMAVFQDLHHPDIGILAAGGHFTMDMKRAGYAAAKFFDFKTIIPCHYRTFPLLEQNADVLAAAVPNATVIEPQVMEPILI